MTRMWNLLLVAALCVAAPAGAESLAFDFDVDDDPTTVENEITAELGEIVEAYLVLGDAPDGYAYVQGLQFGLELSGGLELVGMSVVGIDGAMGNDGTDGIVVLPDEPIAVSELPSFAMRFALEVTATGPQSVAVTPSTGWETSYDGFVYLVSNHADDSDETTVESAEAIATQIAARVNGAPTPVLLISWGGLKAHF